MVRGLELFRRHFRAFADRYALIGGTACDLILSEAGLSFRATKDLDIVLCIESLDTEFARTFWAFVKAGGYGTGETAEGGRRFYRFQKPVEPGYPAMLELFSRVPDALSIAEGSHLTPIPTGGEVSSLSAILLEGDYYDWIQAGRRIVDSIPVVGATHLVALKARAWLDLRAREEEGEEIDSRSIRKHRNDVFRLFQVIDPDAALRPPRRIVDDMSSFLKQVESEELDLRALGLATISREAIFEGLRRLFRSTPEREVR
ncbi:MAG: hypothetical protein MUE73_20795 [Planctomycetes bacterium]|nr:hypothetical protein [Planctomycetota bacterium]